MPSSSHPKFINQEGVDVEEELSETESQAAARKYNEELDMEACLQDLLRSESWSVIIATTCGNTKMKNGPRRTYVEPGTGGRAGPKWISMETREARSAWLSQRGMKRKKAKEIRVKKQNEKLDSL